MMRELEGVVSKWPTISQLKVDEVHDHISLMELVRCQLVEPTHKKVVLLKKDLAQLTAAKLKLVNQDQVDDCVSTWKRLQVFWNERSMELAELTQKLSDDPSFVMATSVCRPWKRAVLPENRVPYYANDDTFTTSWDHPRLTKVLVGMNDLEDVRFSAYRTALKVCRIRDALGLHQVTLNQLKTTLSSCNVIDLTQSLDVDQTARIILKLFQIIGDNEAAVHADLTLNWLLNLHDADRKGEVSTIGVIAAIACMCSNPIDDIYRFLYCRTAETPTISSKQINIFLTSIMKIPSQVNESKAFGGTDASKVAIKQHEGDCMEASKFMDWLLTEPQCLAWLPVMKRLDGARSVTHSNARCVVCRNQISGLLYRCLKKFNCNFCQKCFLSRKVATSYKFSYPIVEYCEQSSPAKNLKDMTKVIRNKLTGKLKRKPSHYDVTSDGKSASTAITDDSPRAQQNQSTHPDVHDLIIGCVNRLPGNSPVQNLNRHSAIFDLRSNQVVLRTPLPRFHGYHSPHTCNGVLPEENYDNVEGKSSNKDYFGDSPNKVITSEEDVWAVSNGNIGSPKSLTKVEQEACSSKSTSGSFAGNSSVETISSEKLTTSKKLTKINLSQNSSKKVPGPQVFTDFKKTETNVVQFSKKAQDLVKELFDLDEIISCVESGDWEKVAAESTTEDRKSVERERNLKNSTNELSPSDYINKLLAAGRSLSDKNTPCNKIT